MHGGRSVARGIGGGVLVCIVCLLVAQANATFEHPSLRSALSTCADFFALVDGLLDKPPPPRAMATAGKLLPLTCGHNGGHSDGEEAALVRHLANAGFLLSPE